MMRVLATTVIAAAILGTLAASGIFAQAPATAPAGTAKPAPTGPLDFKVKDIDGKDVDLKSYSGKVVMILNVASKCGNTPQYTALEAMYKKYQDKGFVIIGFPANDFHAQEPGTNAEIKEFCTAESSQYHITFPLMSKVSVLGSDIEPLFAYLTALECKPLSKGDIAWNFEKFLISRDGKLVGRFSNKTKPDDASIVTAVEAAIAEPAK